jgi:hypothetical protein
MMKRLSAASVMERLDIRSRETLRQLVKKHRIPEPIRESENGPRFWLEDEITSFIRMQAETSRGPREGAQQQAV